MSLGALSGRIIALFFFFLFASSFNSISQVWAQGSTVDDSDLSSNQWSWPGVTEDVPLTLNADRTEHYSTDEGLIVPSFRHGSA